MKNMCKLEELEKSFEVMDATETSIMEKLNDLDPTSEEFTVATENLERVSKAMKDKVDTINSVRNGILPTWATTLIGTAIAVGFGGAVMAVEQNGGVVSSNAISFWDKVIRKF